MFVLTVLLFLDGSGDGPKSKQFPMKYYFWNNQIFPVFNECFSSILFLHSTRNVLCDHKQRSDVLFTWFREHLLQLPPFVVNGTVDTRQVSLHNIQYTETIHHLPPGLH